MSARHFDWIRYHAQVSPHRTALLDLSSGRKLSYALFDERISRLVGHLAEKLGVVRGDRVAALSQNCSELFELLFACARLGAIYVPLNWRLTTHELRYILENAEPRVLATDSSLAGVAAELGAALGLANILEIATPAYEELLRTTKPVTGIATVSFDDIQMIMYTSGTTGFPKGALLTYGMTFWNAINVGIPALITTYTRFLSAMPMFHTAGLNLFANPVFHAGGTVILMRTFNPSSMLAALADPELAITHTFGVPAAYQFMMQEPEFETIEFPSLKVACVGGAATPHRVLEQWHAHGAQMPNGYGMTETSPAVTLLSPADAAARPGSVGQPLLHTEIRIVNSNGDDARINEPGELWVKGPNVTPGYWRNAQATADSFEAGWFKTGDIIRRDEEGFCYVLDRTKDMYISGGENVYPAEVEAVLGSIEGVADVAVISEPNKKWGEVGVAVVVPSNSGTITETDILLLSRLRLAKFKQPHRVVFVDALPRTASGKIHKPTLRKQFVHEA